MDGSQESTIQEQLGPGERLLWTGRPVQGIVFRSSDKFFIPFSLLWGGFAFFWEYSVITSERAPFFFVLWGIPFVLVGLHAIVGRFFTDAKRRTSTVYGVTNQRIVIVSGAGSMRITSLSLRTISDLSLDQMPSGRGTVSFGTPGMSVRRARGIAWPGLEAPGPAFELIEDPKTVCAIIRKAQETAT